MEGLDRIIDSIGAEAQASADALLQKAQGEAALKIEEANTRRANILAEAQKSAEAESAAAVRRAEGLASARHRMSILEQRQSAVTEVLTAAQAALKAMPIPQKAALYSEIVKVHGLSEGVITLPAGDEAVASPLLNQLGSGFSVSPAAGEFSFGLQVQHGKVQDDWSYELALRLLRPSLSALIADTLFEDESPQKETEK